ncbi:MAG: phenylalanine--tRNA ligase subunit beta [Candidatus Micrarchaeota archaeon]
MVVVEFEYSDFKELLGMPKDKVVEILSEIGAPAEVDPETGKIFAEITPNRPDWYSITGLARALHAYNKKEVKKYAAAKGDYRIVVDKTVAKIRPYTTAVVIKGLKLNDLKIRDIVVLQEKLIFTLGRIVKRFGIGIYPLDKIQFPLKYTTMKSSAIAYVPLNYTGKKTSAAEILEKHPKGIAYGYLIKGNKELPVYLDANNNILALIPIVNSEETGKVDESTKDVFIEVTGMDETSITQALNILTCHFLDLGGMAYTVTVEYEKEKKTGPALEYKKVNITEKEVEKILGVALKKEKINEMLGRMGYLVEKGQVYAPPYRTDIINNVDVIEDVAIVYGYNNFEPTTPNFFHPGKKNTRGRRLGDTMARLGFNEITTPILISKEKLAEFGQEGIDVLNPKTVEYTTIRSTALPALVEILVKNKMRGLPQSFYEVGTVVAGKEKTVLVFALVDKSLDFSKARGVLQTLFRECGREFKLENAQLAYFEQPYAANLLHAGKQCGVFGKLAKKIADVYGLEYSIFLCQIDVAALL